MFHTVEGEADLLHSEKRPRRPLQPGWVQMLRKGGKILHFLSFSSPHCLDCHLPLSEHEQDSLNLNIPPQGVATPPATGKQKKGKHKERLYLTENLHFLLPESVQFLQQKEIKQLLTLKTNSNNKNKMNKSNKQLKIMLKNNIPQIIKQQIGLFEEF